jgi:hypothetical protein
MADELDDIARGLDIELLSRGRGLFPEEQRPAHWRHRVRARLDRLVLADVWPRCRRHDTGRGRVSGAPPAREEMDISVAVGNDQGLTPPHSLHPTQYPWEHQKWHKTFDHAA